jgi:hypothetical protein
MQPSAQSSDQRSNAGGADSRTIEPTTNQSKTPVEKPALQLIAPSAPNLENQWRNQSRIKKGGYTPQNVKPAQGASKISQVLGNQSARAALALLS